MRQGADSGIVEWIGMFVSILVMLALSFFQKKPPPEVLEDEEHVERRYQEEIFDDEEFYDTEELQREVQQVAMPKRVTSKGHTNTVKRSVYVQAHAQKQAERVLHANYRLKNALEGFQQRRPIDQRKVPTAIEQRTLNTRVVSEFLSVDADAEARRVAYTQTQEARAKSQAELRRGIIWSEILKPPLALRKGADLL